MDGLPNRASDAGPTDEPLPQDPLTLVDLAEEYLSLYRKARREALRNTPRKQYLIHLQEAIRLLDKAEDAELGI